MTLHQIEYLQAIVRYGSISKASEKLYVAQSSLSEAIRNVENEFHIDIFTRTGKGVALTHQGEEFIKDLRYVADYYQNIELKYKRSRNENEHLYISTHHHIGGPEAFAHLVKQTERAGYLLGCLEEGTVDILNHVSNHTSDIGVLYCTQNGMTPLLIECNQRGLLFHHLLYCDNHVYLHESHPLASRQQIRLKDLESYPFVSYESHTDSVDLFIASPQHRINCEKKISASDRAMIYTLLEQVNAFTTGSGYVSAEERTNGFKAIPVKDMEPIEIGWITHSNSSPSGIVVEYLEILKGLYQQP